MDIEHRRHPGRPPRDSVDTLRTKVWFYLVRELSRRNAGQLEERFALLPRKHRRKQPSLWAKYARGEVTPRPDLVERVEKAYPDTAYWLNMPLWTVVRDKPLSMADMKTVFYSLQCEEVRDLLVFDGAEKQTFWRRPIRFQDVYAELVEIHDIDAWAGVLAMIREAEIIQSQEQHMMGHYFWKEKCQGLYVSPLPDEWDWIEQELYSLIDGLFAPYGRGIRYSNDGAAWMAL